MQIKDAEAMSLRLKESKWSDSEGKTVELFYLNYVVVGEDIVRKVHAGMDYTKRKTLRELSELGLLFLVSGDVDAKGRLEVTNIVRKEFE